MQKNEGKGRGVGGRLYRHVNGSLYHSHKIDFITWKNVRKITGKAL